MNEFRNEIYPTVQNQKKGYEKKDWLFLQLFDNERFKQTLNDVLSRKKTGGVYLREAFGNIWNQTSKHFHGSQSDVVIELNSFSSDECITLVSIFKHFHVESL